MDKNHILINGRKTPYTDEANLLAILRGAGIELPTFCYYSGLSAYGACRMCIVEDARGGILTACSEPPRPGLEIKTHTPRLLRYRKNILSLLLSSHSRECTTCRKNGRCRLQDMTARFGVREVRFDRSNAAHKDEYAIDLSSPSIVRDPNKCIQCGDCVRMCNEKQNVGAVDFALRGYELMVCPAFNAPIADTDCVDCGQCAAVCPTGAITIRNDGTAVFEAINDGNKRVVAQIAPAVRVAFGEEFGLAPGVNAMPLIISAMRKIGFDEVYDTSFSADLTILEEASEFLERLEGGGTLPMFTSCCPAWVKYVENKRPEILPHISGCKSPQQMFGATFKAYAKKRGDGGETVVVSVMPCTAKKAEALRPEFARDGVREVDYVITSQELADMIRQAGIRFDELAPGAPDVPFGTYSGAGLIFGVTGGVTEAVMRKISRDKSFNALESIKFSGVRGFEGLKEFELPAADGPLRIAVVSGLRNADELIARIESGEAHYDFVEVMACPGGCVNGAGQPFHRDWDKKERARGLYAIDDQTAIRHSDANPFAKLIYDEVIGNRAHELLHVHYAARETR